MKREILDTYTLSLYNFMVNKFNNISYIYIISLIHDMPLNEPVEVNIDNVVIKYSKHPTVISRFGNEVTFDDTIFVAQYRKEHGLLRIRYHDETSKEIVL